ncbi:AAA family ATPase [Oscillatoria sp. CS-180]|uniref:AAA family ATPase n=1 Tax=Oscillatoria sp. CS-180 TaxID=3021720 RepID=UPI00232EFF23|nr:AAA family ATPase [Oscillatoria sp. CS-180]MDB9528649.1 AAA family ATPase [Oscillatoria sp. CS-180]
MTFSNSVRLFQTLVMSFHSAIVIETVEEERVRTLINTAINDLQMAVFEWSVAQGLTRSQGNIHNRWTNEYAPPGAQKPQALERTSDPVDALKHIEDIQFQAIYWMKDLGPHLKDEVIGRQLREVIQQFAHNRSTLVITGHNITLPPDIAQAVVYFDLKLPEPDELHQAIAEVVRSLKGRISVQIAPEGMRALVQAMRGMTLQQARQVIAFAALDDGKLTQDDVKRVLQRKVQVLHEEGLLEYIPPEMNPAQLGGFSGLKQWLKRARVGFSAQAKSLNLPAPRGILIVGIQGCGKSLAAKTIAREWQMPLLKLDAGRLYDKFIGESEKNFRRAVTLAETMSPAVLWIDEIEKSMGQSESDTDGGLSRRLFGYFLTWLQEKSEDVFVVATANNLSRIPSELLRKGRFDEIFFVDLPDETERAAILQIHLIRRKQDPRRFKLTELVQATDGFSGAEIEQVIITSLYKAIHERRPVNTELIVEEVKATVPLSVSRREDLHKLRVVAQERFVSVR